MKLFMTLDIWLVRWFGVSLVSYIVCRQAGVPPVPTFILITIGRKSRRRIDTPIFYFRDGNAFFVIGSKGGAPAHPLWFLNLQANPNCWVTVKHKELAMRARVAEEQERSRMWAQAATAYPPYTDYQARAGGREIPVVVLEPRA